MVNISLELNSLRDHLEARGLEYSEIEEAVNSAEKEIMQALNDKLNEGIDMAVESGVQKDSADFINDIRPRFDAFIIDTSSGDTDFSDPPFPMLDRLLSGNVKTMKDGGGVYKVIPVGAPSPMDKPKIHTNIFDAQKAAMAQRHEQASQTARSAPRGSKAEFRTATSKQNRSTQWVLPAKEKNFEEDLNSINEMLLRERDYIILDIINSYMERY
jgi:hypothetical protein